MGFSSVNRLDLSSNGTRQPPCAASPTCTLYDQWLAPVGNWTTLGGVRLPEVS